MLKHKSLSGVWVGGTKIRVPIVPDLEHIFLSVTAVIAQVENLLIGDVSVKASYQDSLYEEDNIPLNGKVGGFSVEFTADDILYRRIVSLCFNYMSGTCSYTANEATIGGPFEFRRQEDQPHALSAKTLEELAVG